MNRLTERLQDGSATTAPGAVFADLSEWKHAILDRLAAYEDTGLSPEEVMARKEGCEDCEISRRVFDFASEFPNLGHIRELVKAEKEGRLLPLPCPIGSTVYVIGHKYRDGWDECWVNRGKFRPSDLEKIGERVFLTYEAAKAKIFAINRGNHRFRFIERSDGDGK